MEQPSAKDAVEIRAYEPTDEADVLRVLQGAFGQWPHEVEDVEPAEFFRWKMTECPFGPSISLVALDQGRVIGFLGQLCWRFRVGEQAVLSTRGMDLGVDPAYRRRGVSTAMTRWAMENNPSKMMLAWNNPNDQSRPGLMKTGRRKVVILPRFARLRGAFGQTLRRASGRGSKTPEELPIEAETAAAVLNDGDYVSRLLTETVEPSNRLVTDRDLDYLRWRYGRLGGYYAFRSDTGASAPGIVIFKVRRRESLWVSDVCELLVAGDENATRRALLRKVRRSAAVDILHASFHSRAEAARCGFLRIGDGVLVTVRKIDGYRGVEPTNPNAWALSLGDVDLL